MRKGTCFRNKLVSLLLALALSLSTTGCQLIVLPFFIVAMTFKLVSQVLNMAIILPIKLLPVAIKYAPLALLFLENSPEDETYYVERLAAAGTDFRIERWHDPSGKQVSALIAPSAAISNVMLSAGRQTLRENEILMLTDDSHQDASPEELAATWDIVKSKPATVWLVGEPVEKMNPRETVAYV